MGSGTNDGLSDQCVAVRSGWWTLNRLGGSEANKLRPAVIVSNDGANMAVARSGMACTHYVKTRPAYEFQVFWRPVRAGFPVTERCNEQRAVAAERLHSVVGLVPAATMAEVDEALRLHLAVRRSPKTHVTPEVGAVSGGDAGKSP